MIRRALCKLLQAVAVATILCSPFIVYFWGMKP
jgi:hypothetical protein